MNKICICQVFEKYYKIYCSFESRMHIIYIYIYGYILIDTHNIHFLNHILLNIKNLKYIKYIPTSKIILYNNHIILHFL